MANNMERFIFEVDADTSRALKKLEDISRLMTTIEKINTKGRDNYFTTTQKDMDKNLRTMSQLTSEMNNLDRLMARMKSNAASSENPDTGLIKSIQKQQQETRRAYEQTLKIYRETAGYQQKMSKDFKNIFNSNDLNNFSQGIDGVLDKTEEASKRLNRLRAQINEANKLDRRVESQARRASASGYMSFQQASNMRGDAATVRGEFVSTSRQNREQLQTLSNRRRELSRETERIANNPLNTEQDRRRKVAYEQEMRDIDEEIAKRRQLDEAIKRTTENLERSMESLNDVNVKPDRSTWRGMLYERAPAIGLSATGAMAGAAGMLYSQGSSIHDNVRDDVISMAQRTGINNESYAIRENAENLGLSNNLGLTSAEVLAYQDAFLANNGYTNQRELDSMAVQQGTFQRATGMDADTTKDFFSTMFQTGAVQGDMATEIQNAFIGAIKQSGMEGREKEQLAALQTLTKQNAEGRNVTSDEVRNLMGIQSVLAASGDRSLQGENGGQLLTGMDAGIKGAASDPTLRMIFGQGTEFQGLTGLYELEKKLEKGVSDPSNVQDVANWAMTQDSTAQGQDVAFLKLFRDQMGVDMSIDQASALMNQVRQGNLSQESIQNAMSSAEASGASASEKNLSNYNGMDEATENQSNATTERMAAGLYDLGDVARDVNSAMSGVPPVAYGAIAALGTLTAAFLGAAASFGLSGGIRRFGSDTFGGGGGRGKGRGRRGGGGGSPGGGNRSTRRSLRSDGTDDVRKPTTLDRVKGAGSGAWDSAKSWGSNVWEKSKGLFSGGKGGGKGGSGIIEGGLGGGGKLLGRALPAIGLGAGLLSIFNAPEDKKGEAIGSTAGGFAGAAAGAAGGAAIGSIIPGAGTAVGGIVGGIGGLLGGWLGSEGGGWLGGLFDKDSKKSEDKAEKQLERENTNKKDQAEARKEKNLAEERDNLNTYQKLLGISNDQLNKASAQGGIFGSPGGASAGGAASQSSGYSGTLGDADSIRTMSLAGMPSDVTAESLNKWINSNAKKGSTMYNQGEAFMKAAQESGLDPRYLVAHAAHETGWGSSNISKQKGNMYGIGAFDASPYASAYGFSNATAGIIEGAKWISENYTQKGQDTLASMRHNNGKHEYATDPLWDEKIAKIMAGAPSGGGGTSTVNGTININVSAEDSVADKVADSQEMKKLQQKVFKDIFGAAAQYRNETARV